SPASRARCTPRAWRWCARSWRLRARWASRPSARAWKASTSAGCWRSWAATTGRASCSASRSPRPRRRRARGGNGTGSAAASTDRGWRAGAAGEDARGLDQFDELAAQPPPVPAGGSACAGRDVAHVPAVDVPAPPQRVRPGRDGRGEAQRRAGLRADRVAAYRRLDQPAVFLPRALVAQAQVRKFIRVRPAGRGPAAVAQWREPFAAGAGKRDLVQRGDLVAGTDVAGV